MDIPRHRLTRPERIKAIREEAYSSGKVHRCDLRWLISEIESLSIEAARLVELGRDFRQIQGEKSKYMQSAGKTCILAEMETATKTCLVEPDGTYKKRAII
jgi:hypothetical protein